MSTLGLFSREATFAHTRRGLVISKGVTSRNLREIAEIEKDSVLGKNNRDSILTILIVKDNKKYEVTEYYPYYKRLFRY